MIAPPGGVPAALTNLPGLGRQIAALTGTEAYRIGVLPGQSVSFTSEPVAEPLTLVGSPRARVRLTSSTDSATLFAALWDLGPDTAGGSAPTSAVAAAGWRWRRSGSRASSRARRRTSRSTSRRSRTGSGPGTGSSW